MNRNIFNYTIFLWAGAIAVALFIVDPRAALVQRINTMNVVSADCLSDKNCADTKAITESREYYMILAQLYPDYGRGFEMEGVCYLLLKQDSLAIKKFREAIKHNPDLFWVSFELGKAYYRRGEYSQALKYFQGITAQDNDALLKKATLSTLRQFSDKTREVLMLSLVEFVTEIKLQSFQMAIGCLAHQGKLTQAKSEDNARKEMLLRIDKLAYSKPVFHPWSHVIQPLKEILYP
jgi:tetratricopeptide (TPR) repeat protein